MKPKEVAEVYKKQAKYMELFLKKIEDKDYSISEYKEMIAIVGGQYYELLQTLAYHTESLENYGVLFFKVNPFNLEEPPIDPEFFKDRGDL